MIKDRERPDQTFFFFGFVSAPAPAPALQISTEGKRHRFSGTCSLPPWFFFIISSVRLFPSFYYPQTPSFSCHLDSSSSPSSLFQRNIFFSSAHGCSPDVSWTSGAFSFSDRMTLWHHNSWILFCILFLIWNERHQFEIFTIDFTVFFCRNKVEELCCDHIISIHFYCSF